MFTRCLTSANSAQSFLIDGTTKTFGGYDVIPLGTNGGSAGGELYVKVGLVSAGSSGITVDTQPYQYSGTASFGAATGGTTSITAFTVATNGVGFIQNLATSPLIVKRGTAAATNSFSLILKGCSTANDGTGGSVYFNDYAGPVSAIPASGTSNFIAWATT